jgi:hypothetical protein
MTQDNYFMATRSGLGGVNGSIVGFGSAIRKERLLQTARGDLMKFLREV